MNVLDLFSGIGGFSLGLERAGMRTVAFCEIEPYPRAVLRKHWPAVPIFEDIRELPAEDFAGVDVVSGGFPCQAFSTASHGRRIAEDLWPGMQRVISIIRPTFVIAENVNESAIKWAANDSEKLGYRTVVRRIGAHDCGADHKRNRWWLCAYPHNQSELPRLIDAEVAQLSAVCRGLWGPANYARATRVSDGVPNRTHRIKALGNAVVPQVVEMIGRAIMEADKADG